MNSYRYSLPTSSNICCDETFDLGKGKNSSLAAEIGECKLYLYFVRGLIEHLKSRKRESYDVGGHIAQISGNHQRNT